MTEPGGEAWLEDVRREYLSSADCKIADLSDAIRRLQSAPESVEARRNLRTLLHNLIGSGASYGFAGVSVIAQRMSSALKRATDERMIAETDLFTLLENGLRELREVFEREAEGMDGRERSNEDAGEL